MIPPKIKSFSQGLNVTLLVLFMLSASMSINAQEVFTPEQKLQELSIELFPPRKPLANYVPIVRTGNLLFLSGTGPTQADGTIITGKLGEDLTIEEGYAAARLTAIRQISILKDELGDLSKVKRIVKVLGMVNCTPEFSMHPAVINGFSDLMVAVFGDSGKHARSAVGMNALPFNMAVEIEMIVEVED